MATRNREPIARYFWTAASVGGPLYRDDHEHRSPYAAGACFRRARVYLGLGPNAKLRVAHRPWSPEPTVMEQGEFGEAASC